MSNSSGAFLDCEFVLNKCNETITKIQNERKHRDAEYLKKNNKPFKKYWFFGPKIQLTNEEFTKKHSSCFADFSFPSIYAFDALDRATKIRKLAVAQHRDSKIFISVEDWNLIT